MTLASEWTVEALGYAAAAMVFVTFCMKSMLLLRLAGIASNVAFLLYALTADLVPIMVLHGALLPLNVLRLVQMEWEIRRARAAREAPPEKRRFDWLMPMASRRELAPDEAVFHKGEQADSLFVVDEGFVYLPESGVTVGPGSLLGEIGLFAGDRQRTASAISVGRAVLGEISERRLRELCFDNPRFSYELTCLITQRMIENVQRAEGTGKPVAG